MLGAYYEALKILKLRICLLCLGFLLGKFAVMKFAKCDVISLSH